MLSAHAIVIRRPFLLSQFQSTFFVEFVGAEATPSQAEIDRHLELGKDFLARGQLGDALTHYHAAVGQYEIHHLCFFFASVHLLSTTHD